MIRLVAATVLLASIATAALAQTSGGPPIAYVKQFSTGDEIYLINPGGTSQTKLYKAPPKTSINMVDLRPGGGEIAFTESLKTLKVLQFDDYGRPAVGEPRTVSSSCSLFAPDYHPTNGSLLFIEGCGAANFAVWSVQPGATTKDPDPVFSAYAVGKVRWSRDGAFIYYPAERNDGSSIIYLYRRDAASGATAELGPIDTYRSFDVTRTGDRIYWGWGNFKILDLAAASTTAAATNACFRAADAHFGPGDAEIAYLTTSPVKGSYVMAGASDCSGRDRALTGNGKWGSWLDWRP